MNLVMFPMWIGSSTFFSTERFPQAVQPFVQALPLTAINDAARRDAPGRGLGDRARTRHPPRLGHRLLYWPCASSAGSKPAGAS
jgi:hypothetical protein